MTHIAVYGTLRKGMGNHRLLQGAEHKLDYKLHEHAMYCLGGIPGVKYTGNPEHTVNVEVYHVTPDILQRLDRLEGYNADTHTGMYLREPAGLVPIDGTPVPVSIYIWNHDVNGRTLIKGGDFVKWRELDYAL